MNSPRDPAPPAPGPAPRRQPAYAEHARSYERDTAAFQPYRRAVVEALPLRPGQVVLDVGCGTGLCCGLLREKVGPAGEVVGIEESPDMVAVARAHIADEGWENVTVLHAPAEDAEFGLTADAALFCAVHDILQSPGALKNVMTTLRPGAWVAAGGGKWAAPVMIALNSMVSMLHAPYVRDFTGFDRPWRHLEQMVEDVRVREMAFGSGYIMTGRAPA
jgi:demethylmenaquinone methyltransferase/2-methoxy-6-polyprenyl-1,4-benzoquinol methylase